MSHRVEQLGGALQQAIQSVISRGLADPRVRGLITVTRVEVSQDKRDATVFVSILPEEHEDLTMHGLRAAGAHIRRQAGELISMHRLPTLHFKLDRTLKAQARVIEAINRAIETSPTRDTNERTRTEEQTEDTP